MTALRSHVDKTNIIDTMSVCLFVCLWGSEIEIWQYRLLGKASAKQVLSAIMAGHYGA